MGGITPEIQRAINIVWAKTIGNTGGRVEKLNAASSREGTKKIKEIIQEMCLAFVEHWRKYVVKKSTIGET